MYFKMVFLLSNTVSCALRHAIPTKDPLMYNLHRSTQRSKCRLHLDYLDYVQYHQINHY